jgi:hypothetical protein
MGKSFKTVNATGILQILNEFMKLTITPTNRKPSYIRLNIGELNIRKQEEQQPF